MKEKFKILYNEVFDEKGNIKNCGREKCKELIIYCESINPNISYGNKNTGFIYIKNIKELYRNI